MSTHPSLHATMRPKPSTVAFLGTLAILVGVILLRAKAEPPKVEARAYQEERPASAPSAIRFQSGFSAFGKK